VRPKNVMLLGFINRAVEYLDKHMDEEPNTRLAELKNIDLESIREELVDNLDTSLGTMQSTMSTLLKAGNEAFDDFIEGNLGLDRASVSSQFNKIFDIDLDVNPKNKQNDIAKLLSFYNLESDIDEAELDETSETDQYMQEIMKKASNNDIREVAKNVNGERSSNSELDSIFSEIIRNEESKLVDKQTVKTVPTQIEEVEIEEPKQNSEEYVSTLVEDLKKQLQKEEEIKKKYEFDNKEVYESVSQIYPYLPKSFIGSVYEMKQSIEDDYPSDVNVIVLHRIKFSNVENLRKFVEIVLNHNYSINADENKMIVDVMKRFKNTEGKIINNIYGIANQGFLLEGNYEGYNVIIDK